MTIAELIRTLESQALVTAVRGADDRGLARSVTAVAYDSRSVGGGALFVALKGLRADGTAFADQAIARGAAAIVSESEKTPTAHVPWIVVSDARLALARLASAFFGEPSAQMQVIGITGTNGKTTTAYLTCALFEAAGFRCGLLGTVVYRLGDREEREATRTTPEAPDVQALLREMVDCGCRVSAMEVSSHALALKRVDGTRFAAGVFTNLTRDHLDFHADMEAYFQAKRRLFEMLPPEAPAVINVDDPRGAALIDVAGRPVTYAINRPADVTPGPLSFSLQGLSFDVRTPRGALRVRSQLVGRPNVYNLLAAIATATAFDLPFDAIERGVRSLKGVPGRFEVVSGLGDDITAVVDYAHTDDALRNLLETARPLAGRRLITVFGCGGDRDRTKRPLMGAVAGRLSDLVIVTSDNPRSEDPARIIDEVKRGFVPPPERARPSEAAPRNGQRALAPAYEAIVDRRAAIERAIEVAQPGDLVLIAGKGHEKYQVIGDRVLPFDDGAVARDALARRRVRSGVG